MNVIHISSPSAATDAAWLAAADISSTAEAIGANYRLVGGLSITLLTHHAGVDLEVPARETADADLGVPHEVCADPRLLAGLTDRGYRLDGGNRFIREHESAARLTIDVLGPSRDLRLQSNVRAGMLSVDLIPGLSTALRLDPVRVDVNARLQDGQRLELRLALPHPCAALVMKAHAYRGRFESRDAADIWRLLVVADRVGLTGGDWPASLESRVAAYYLHQFFAASNSRGGKAAGASSRDQGKIRLLTNRVVPEPTL